MVILLTPNHGVFCSADDSTHFQNYRQWDVSKIQLRGLMEKPVLYCEKTTPNQLSALNPKFNEL
jgi:hypothetical protein